MYNEAMMGDVAEINAKPSHFAFDAGPAALASGHDVALMI